MASGYRLSYECYGHKTYLYIQCPDQETRGLLEAHLENKGVKVNKKFNPSSSTLEVQVTYFPGGYDE